MAQLLSLAARMGFLFRHYVVVVGLWLGVVVVVFGVGMVHAEDKNTFSPPAMDRPPSTSLTTPAVTLPRQCICTMEFDPVCGRTPEGAELTFSNPCRAHCVSATVIRRGPC